MIKIQPNYRTIIELEEEWACTTSDIFNWASQGLLKIWETDSLRLRKEQESIPKEKADEIFHMLTLEGQELIDYLEIDFNSEEYNHSAGVDFAITTEEQQRFERLNKEQESEDERKSRLAKQREEKAVRSGVLFDVFWNTSAEKKDLLEMPEDHPYFSRELQIANQCWKELYGFNKDVTPKRGHKKMIEKWLDSYQQKSSVKLSNAALERIATLVNPNPKGGAPRTE